MTMAANYICESPIGLAAAGVRIGLQLTQQELADIAGVSRKDVELFEHSLPVMLGIKNKLLKALWAEKTASRN